MQYTFKIIVIPLILMGANLALGQDWKSAREVLTSRCVACHSCYSSPCQVNLTSFEGLARGGSKERVYDGTRLLTARPSRLYIDANSTKEWRDNFHFYPVIPEGKHNGSLFMNALGLGKDRGNRYVGKNFDALNNQICPSNHEEWKSFEKDLLRGMPFGFPTLTTKEYDTLQTWADAGYKAQEPSMREQLANLPKDVKSTISTWEKFLNTQNLKQRIVSRYLYEHWFIAHLHFSSQSPYFFRLIRSRSDAPRTPIEVPTRRPFDDPKEERFFYRFVLVQGPTMHKTHIIYQADQETFNFIKNNLLNAKWTTEPTKFPSYGDSGANPISTFRDMPAKGRYQFFLRDARYFAMTFIRGPVCEGQIAVNVIEDQFQVFFLDPDFDLAIQQPHFLRDAAQFLELPAKGESDPIESFYLRYKEQQLKYLKFRAERYGAHKNSIYDPRAIWDGDGHDQDAVLTIFRHFDNAGVIKGAWGGPPKTLWIMDYPIFERMYYLLVAGFDVYGNLFHQASTRMYMDNLRMEAENNFIYMFDDKSREAIRKTWYVGSWAREKIAEFNPLHNSNYRSDPKAPNAEVNPEKAIQDMRGKILQSRVSKVVNAEDSFYSARNQSILKELTPLRGGFTSHMPELTLLVINGNPAEKSEVVFLSKVTAHTNVSFMIGEGYHLVPKDDRLSLVPHWLGSYPNFMITINKAELPQFVSDLKKSQNKKTVESVLGKYGITRADSDFWPQYDAIESTLEREYPREYGRLDLSKYANIY